MNWKSAKPYQLYEIAYNDKGCSVEHREAARAEIKRRQKPRYNHQQVKIRRKRA